MGTDHSQAVRVVAEALCPTLAHSAFMSDDVVMMIHVRGYCDICERRAIAAVEAYLSATTGGEDCPSRGFDSGPDHWADCPDCNGSGKLPSRYLVVVDAERDGKLVRGTIDDEAMVKPDGWYLAVNDGYAYPAFREVPPEETR